MNDKHKFWDDCYAEGRTGWDRGDVHPALLNWLNNRSLSPCSIIVPGCGRGFEVVELARHDFDVTAVDIANHPVQHLRKQLSGHEANARVVQQNIFEFTPPQPVDAVYEQTCLCAIAPDMRAKYEQTVFNWLKPTGDLFVLFAQKAVNPNQGPPFHCDLAEMQEIFCPTRWRWPASKSPTRFDHPNGKLFELAYVLKKKAT